MCSVVRACECFLKVSIFYPIHCTHRGNTSSKVSYGNRFILNTCLQSVGNCVLYTSVGPDSVFRVSKSMTIYRFLVTVYILFSSHLNRLLFLIQINYILSGEVFYRFSSVRFNVNLNRGAQDKHFG